MASGCGSSSSKLAAQGPPPGPYKGSEPPPGIVAPDFALRSYRGPLVRMRALRGKVVVVTFLDTKCTQQCPIIAGLIGRAIPLLSAAERRQVEALAISVNPRTDNSETAGVFLQQRHALGRLDFLLGSVAVLRPLWKAFHILSAYETGSADIHSADVRVFDRRGVWVSTLHVAVDLTPQNLVHDIRVALRAKGTS